MSDTNPPKLFGIVFWLHLPLVLAANFSFILFDYRLILVGILFVFAEYGLFQGCVLTNMQFGKNNDLTFYTLYLEKLGFRFNRRKLKIYFRYIHPFIILGIAILLQITLNINPLFGKL